MKWISVLAACIWCVAFAAGIFAAGPASQPTSPATAPSTTYITWINVWIGHDQKHWWKPEDYHGVKVCIGGRWQSIDWAETSHQIYYLDQIKEAGVNAVVADLTNGWGWLNERCKAIQGLCAQRNLRFCIAENSGGDPAKFEQRARDVWTHFAGPDAPHPQTYLQYHGKPLIVCYCIRPQFEKIQASTGPWRSRFNVVWASGEDKEKDKWGWQLDPRAGAIPSADSMFVTPCMKWGRDHNDAWRKSLAWFDYNFLLARQSRPQFLIVGSYDDVPEHNGWLVADTSAATERGRQMRDAAGAISKTAYYERVKQWIAGKPATIPGGCLTDGCYRIVNEATAGAISTHGIDWRIGAPLCQRKMSVGMEDRVWIYHLGENQYRLIALGSSLALSAPAGATKDSPPLLQQQWDDPGPAQRWTIKLLATGRYTLTNLATGNSPAARVEPAEAGAPIVLEPVNASRAQQWRFEPVLTLK